MAESSPTWDNDLEPEEAKEALRAAMKEHEIEILCSYVHQHDAMSKPYRELRLTWRYQLKIKGQLRQCGDYSAGIAYCPSYSYKEEQRRSKDYDTAIRNEVGTGLGSDRYHKPILPDPVDVFSCLLSDADAIEYPNFEAWAREFGANEDSRKAEATYRLCLETGLTLRAYLGEKLLQELRELGMQM